MEWGETFCRVYETYARLFNCPALSFEHACHLQRALGQQRELGLDECPRCGALIVVATFAPRSPDCDFCAADHPSPGPGRGTDG